MDATFENLTVSNGYNGHHCYEYVENEHAIPLTYCVRQILYVWAKGG